MLLLFKGYELLFTLNLFWSTTRKSGEATVQGGPPLRVRFSSLRWTCLHRPYDQCCQWYTGWNDNGQNYPAVLVLSACTLMQALGKASCAYNWNLTGLQCLPRFRGIDLSQLCKSRVNILSLSTVIFWNTSLWRASAEFIHPRVCTTEAWKKC